MNYDANRDVVVRFDHPEEYLAWLKNIPRKFMYDNLLSFCGDTFEGALYKLEHGDTTNVDAASQIIDQMQNEQVFVKGLPIMQPSVVGGFVNVPAMLSGHPRQMYNRMESDIISTNVPLCIYYHCNINAMLTAQETMNRGIAVLALTMALNVVRPVELYAVSAAHASDTAQVQGVICKIETKPLDLARAAYMLTSLSYNRRLYFTAGGYLAGENASDKSIGFAYRGHIENPIDYYKSMRELIGATEDDLFIARGDSHDTTMTNDPIAWVKQMIDKHNTRENV